CRTEPTHCFESRVRLDCPFFDNESTDPPFVIARLARLVRASDVYRDRLLEEDVYNEEEEVGLEDDAADSVLVENIQNTIGLFV
ncbi:hypothetical protein HK100_010047, partial [Physocladia obscura]